ncbi:DUF1707 SHOCT-like domain-containing protein [Streptomyces lasiicapitis]|uniref:DUF1707 SHOCT-like domain-containing protein n=1 Tax=Streptomyces lasiicapitis TaxID=1923961 RepID=UPI003658CB2F
MPTEPRENPNLRATEADREAVVERLQEAAADGRLGFEELDERLGLALSATTHGDLVPLTADLTPAVLPSTAEPLVLDGGSHGLSRTGRWQVPPHITVHGGSGGATVDFTETECVLSEVGVEAHGDKGGVTLVVPDSWAVDSDEVDPGFGGVTNRTTAGHLPGSPLIRLTGTGGSGGLYVRHPSGRQRRRQQRT